MAWNRWMPAAVAAAAITLAAGCAGGSSSLVPGQQSAGSTQTSSRLTTTSAPSKRVQEIYARKAVSRGTVQDPLANWVFLEPVAITDTAAFSVPSWVTGCSSIDPIFGGLWYLSLSNFSTPLSSISLPSCTLPASASTDVALHRDGLLPSGNGNVYIVELNVGFISLSTTPIAGPALNGNNSTFLLASLQNSLAFQQFHLYAFFLAEYTGTGTPTTESI